MDFTIFNTAQEEAIRTTQGGLLVLAGAGSGKTRVIVHRIAYLLEQKAIPSSILALTFTNKAAGEMQNRLEELLGGKSQGLWIGTFHSMCLRILRREISRLGYSSSFAIYDSYDQKVVIKECMRQANISEKTLKPSYVLSRISSAKNEMISPGEYEEKWALDKVSKQVSHLYRLYQQRLKTNNAVDFDDIILLTINLMQEYTDVLDFYSRKFQYILVDEYQDTNHAQYLLVQLLSSFHKNLCVVGDDDQSIYGWRGADIRNILEFKEAWPEAKVIKLEQNYRSTKPILEAAHKVISKNTTRHHKKLWTEKQGGEDIHRKKVFSDKDEALYISNQIWTLIHKKGKNLKDIAVLYRTNAQSRLLEESLIKNHLPYQIFGGLRFYERKEIKDMVAYLTLIANSADDLSLKRIINVPRRGIGPKTIQILESHSLSQGRNILELLSTGDVPDLSNAARRKLDGFVQQIRSLATMAQVLSVSELLKKVMENTLYLQELEDDSSDEAQSRIENLQELVNVAADFEKKNGDATLEDFLAGISLFSDLDRLEEGTQAVSLMTLHSSKGLEYPVVFICGLEEGLFPSALSLMEESKLEEERRLCYVGITRAKESLYLSWATERMLYGKTTSQRPSRFMKDLEENPKEEVPEKKGSLYQRYAQKYKLDEKPALSPAVDKTYGEAGKTPTGEKTPQKLPDGTKISHDIFGKGIVVSSDGNTHTILFESKGIKKIDTSYIALKVL